MISSLSISAAEQQTILSAARFAVVRYVYRFADKNGHKHFFSKEDVDDLVQDTVYKAFRSIGSYDPSKAKLSTWVGSIAFNCVKDSIDYRMKRLGISESMPVMQTDDEDEQDASELVDKRSGCVPMAADGSYNADREIERKEFERQVWHEAEKLGERNERVVRLLANEFTPKEIAAVEGCTPSAAATRVCRVRRVLGGALADAAREFGFLHPDLAS